jgi:mannan endo-1,6-alpha-mannosidase
MYTGDQDYLDWAEQTWDWSRSVDMVSDEFSVYDGTDDLKGCTDMNHIQWSYNAGVYLYGAAVMWNVVSTLLR